VDLTVWMLCATFWPRGPDKEITVLAGLILSKYPPFFTYVSLMIILFRQYCKYWGGKTYLKLIFKNGINCKKIYTNLNVTSHYFCLFFFIYPERN